MQVHVSLLAIVVILVASTESRPSNFDLFYSNVPYDPDDLQPQILQYYSAPLYFYNLQGVPASLIIDKKETIHKIPAYNFYYDMPSDDANKKNKKPNFIVKSAKHTPTTISSENNDKCVENCEPQMEIKTANESPEGGTGDTVTVEAAEN